MIMRISGLSNGNLDFIQNLKSLSVLMLRNNRLSGSIPNDIGEHGFEFQQFEWGDSKRIVQLESNVFLASSNATGSPSLRQENVPP
ncbi:unnamed protein product [Lactuca virosa]|uniref:Uncharacterized protein n=1 Tax=Lactuca virosa TaxID=75947 RepID=A0AAU9ME60_9ASTR|nr:unnamed protein product [Lactuca virosa]